MNSDFLPRRSQNENKPFQPRPQARPQQSFQTPEQVASQDSFHAATHGSPGASVGSGLGGSAIHGSSLEAKPPGGKKSLKQRLQELTKKQWVIIITIAVLLLGIGGFALYHFVLKNDKPVVPAVKQPAPEPPAPPKPIVSTLTGLPIVDATINERPVTAVMIENSPDARPQSGLLQAGVVFEAVAEGGITRFLTLFQDQEPEYIGPVRSVRPYYVQWLAGFDAAVAHVGGSADALAMLKRGEAKDLDQFSNPGPYRRVSSRRAPHNMYSNVVALRELQQKKGFTSKYSGFPRKPEAPSATPSANAVDFRISSPTYNAHYDYDIASNSYKRSEGGKSHIDEASGQQLSPKVVIAMTLPQSNAGIYTVYGTIGSGEVHIFQDGIVAKGTWSKADAKSQIVFKDSSGTDLMLNPGQTWITALGDSGRITIR